MARVRRIGAVACALVIGFGFVGAWASNPDSGAVLHDALLWHICGSMFEIGMLIVSVLLVGLVAVWRNTWSMSLRHR
jgi:hypothetical protein